MKYEDIETEVELDAEKMALKTYINNGDEIDFPVISVRENDDKIRIFNSYSELYNGLEGTETHLISNKDTVKQILSKIDSFKNADEMVFLMGLKKLDSLEIPDHSGLTKIANLKLSAMNTYSEIFQTCSPDNGGDYENIQYYEDWFATTININTVSSTLNNYIDVQIFDNATQLGLYAIVNEKGVTNIADLDVVDLVNTMIEDTEGLFKFYQIDNQTVDVETVQENFNNTLWAENPVPNAREIKNTPMGKHTFNRSEMLQMMNQVNEMALRESIELIKHYQEMELKQTNKVKRKKQSIG